MSHLILSAPEAPIHAEIKLPASKSECNRALIIRSLTEHQSGNQIQVHNISEARDSQTMLRLLESEEETLNVLDAGTTMRFLIAFCAITQQNKILTGTARMQERPIQILVDALRELGFQLEYLHKEGYPPVKIIGQENFTQLKKHIQIRGDVSSQYISALLMIAPLLPKGIILELMGKISSRPYIQMTLDQMQHFGIHHQWIDQSIHITPQTYQADQYTIESDWSAASYWYSIVSLAQHAKVKLLGLREKSSQGDQAIVQIMEDLGVRTEYVEDGVVLEKKTIRSDLSLNLDFSDCPDLAQTVLVVCAAKKVGLLCKGLESLKIKETDRIAALQKELKKFDCDLHEDYCYWSLRFGEWSPGDNSLSQKSPIEIHTYEDHRMAMAFAPLTVLHPLKIQDPEVVVKSYPGFWEDLKQVGFTILMPE
ncbi:MAG: 3-phosphoshikimate 1-carboxyvinyltransferase [Microscillaceae bacterium]|nr:3-phosphoshikimate 1-carboxyvinyltransferase [Microscillaceae bacterium]